MRPLLVVESSKTKAYLYCVLFIQSDFGGFNVFMVAVWLVCQRPHRLRTLHTDCEWSVII